MIFKKEDNTYTETDEEKLEMLSTHLEIVFNSDVNIDWSILSEITQKLVVKIIDTTLQFNEFSFVINKLTLHRAGYKRHFTECHKSSGKENGKFYLRYTQNF